MTAQHFSNQMSVEAARTSLTSWLDAFNNRNLDSLMALYDPEIVYMNADSPAAIGIEAVSQGFKELFINIEGVTLKIKEEYAFGGSDMAVLIGTYFFAPSASTSSSELTGRVTFVYRLNASNEWKLVHDIDNSPPDATVEAFKEVNF